MNTKKTHVYFVPGLAAGTEIFRSILMSPERYETHVLEWFIPDKKEPLEVYAKRMAARVTEPDSVLIGVSFGGVVAQEMSLYLNLKRLIIISSVKTKYELPRRLKLARKTMVYKLIPTRLVLSASDLTKFSMGPRSKKRLRLYQEYLHVRDKTYLDWAIKNMVCWDRTHPIEKVVHIHGDADLVFPIRNIKECHVITGGSHVMLVNKGGKVSKKIQAIIEE